MLEYAYSMLEERQDPLLLSLSIIKGNKKTPVL
jgi:hypothetical protein